MNLQINFPANHQPERNYIASVIFDEILGLPVSINFSDNIIHPEILFGNNKKLIIEDHFFSINPTPLFYLDKKYIPNEPMFINQNENPFLTENELPVIYGRPYINADRNLIHCGIDLFGSSFYMLTRWEEYVLPDQDMHCRFAYSASLAVKWSFLQRPIVNEMAIMLWNMLVHLGFSEKRKVNKFDIMLTHDVDLPLFVRSNFHIVKKILGDIFKRRNLNEALFTIKSFFNTIFNIENDPYNTFHYLMHLSEKLNLRSHFFFLCGGKSKFDESMPIDSPFMQKLIEEIMLRGHHIGIHPSYNSYLDSKLIKEQKEILESNTKTKIISGRQHFLRFRTPITWQILEDNGIEWDSSIYYPDMAGFRCGICHAFSVFNILTRKKLKLKELPISAMEVTWTNYLKSPPEEMLAEIKTLIQTVKKYDGTFVLLWHNSSFYTPHFKLYATIYEKIIDALRVNQV